MHTRYFLLVFLVHLSLAGAILPAQAQEGTIEKLTVQGLRRMDPQAFSWLLEIEDLELRKDATLDLILGLLHSRDAWTRHYGLQELRWMAARQDGIFTRERRERLRTAGRASAHPEVKVGVESVTRALIEKDARMRRHEGSEQSGP